MKVVIDTNVLVSAVLKGRKPGEIIEFIGENESIEWLVSPEIVEEYREVLNRPKLKLTDATRREWLEKIERLFRPIGVSRDVDFPRDRKDAKFLALALTAGADFLITGDRDFEEIAEIGETMIISVSAFKELVIDALEEPDAESREGGSQRD
jgi:uncharacterized protein